MNKDIPAEANVSRKLVLQPLEQGRPLAVSSQITGLSEEEIRAIQEESTIH